MATLLRRVTLVLLGTGWSAFALAQAPVAVEGGAVARQSAPSDVVLSGSFLSIGSSASPRPSPSLTTAVAFPRQGVPVDAGYFQVYPYLGLGVGYNDNITGVPDDEIGSTVLVASPRLQATAQSGGNVYALTFAGNFGHYSSSSANDFNDYAFVASSSNSFTARADAEAAAFYMVLHDTGGSVDRPFTGTPDRYSVAGAVGTFGYGAQAAQGRLEIDLGYTEKRYLNNLESTAIFDVNAWNAAGRFFYRIAPATRLFAEVRYADYDYTESSSPYTNTEQRYLIGATWDATAATSGTVRLGYDSKRFKAEGSNGYAGVVGDLSLRWLPRTYSTVEVIASYAPSDSTGSATYTLDTVVGARWEHYWRSYFLTRVYGSYTHSEYEGVSQVDKTSRVGVGAFYDLTRWLRIGADYAYESRSSTNAGFDYSRNVILLSVAGTL